MGFKEDNKNKYLDPFKRATVNIKSPVSRINVSSEIIGNRIRITVPKDANGNLTGTIVENIALENSTWIFEPVDGAIIDERVDRKLRPEKYMDLSKFDFEKGYLPKEILPDLEVPVQFRKDYCPFAKKVLEHPSAEVRKNAIEHIDDEDVLAAIILFSKDNDISLFVLDYIKDVSIICDIVMNNFNYYYFTGVADIFYDLDKKNLPLRLFDREIRKAALKRIEDRDTLLELGLDFEGWFAPIDMIWENKLMNQKEIEELDLCNQNKEISEIILNRLKNEF